MSKEPFNRNKTYKNIGEIEGNPGPKATTTAIGNIIEKTNRTPETPTLVYPNKTVHQDMFGRIIELTGEPILYTHFDSGEAVTDNSTYNVKEPYNNLGDKEEREEGFKPPKRR